MPDQRIEHYLNAVGKQLGGMPASQREQELQEIRQHLEELVQDYIQRGYDESDAVDVTLSRFGPANDIGNGLRDAWEPPKARIWRPNRLLAVSLGIATAGMAAAYAAMFDRFDNVRDPLALGETNVVLIFYLAVFAVAVIAAGVARSWAVATLVPVSMLATWVVVDLSYGNDIYLRWGLTYLNQRGWEFDLIAGAMLRSLQLMPALAGATLGGLIGTWMSRKRYSATAFLSSIPGAVLQRVRR